MIILAHGMPKSGSTFLYQVIRDLAEIHNGANGYAVRERYLAASQLDHQDFYTTVEDDVLFDALARIPDDVLYVIKTHGTMSDRALKQLASGKLKIFYSYRDPRDVALSMLDAGRRERKEGVERYFHQFSETQSLCPSIRLAFTCIEPLMQERDAYDYPYFIIAEQQEWVIRRVAETLGMSTHADSLLAKYDRVSNSDKIVEFNKGIYNRFITELDREDISHLTEALDHEIRLVDQQSLAFAARENLGAHYSDLVRARDEAIADKVGADL